MHCHGVYIGVQLSYLFVWTFHVKEVSSKDIGYPEGWFLRVKWDPDALLAKTTNNILAFSDAPRGMCGNK